MIHDWWYIIDGDCWWLMVDDWLLTVDDRWLMVDSWWLIVDNWRLMVDDWDWLLMIDCWWLIVDDWWLMIDWRLIIDGWWLSVDSDHDDDDNDWRYCSFVRCNVLLFNKWILILLLVNTNFDYATSIFWLCKSRGWNPQLVHFPSFIVSLNLILIKTVHLF